MFLRFRYKGAVVRTALYAADGGNVALFTLNGQTTCALQTFPMINPGVANIGQGLPCVFVPGVWTLTVGSVYRGGLHATYYNNQLLTVPYSSTVDTSWFFKDWGSSAPLGSLSRSDFGVRSSPHCAQPPAACVVLLTVWPCRCDGAVTSGRI